MQSGRTTLSLIYIIILVLLLALAGYLLVQYRLQTDKINMLLEERNFLLETASTTKAFRQEQDLASSTIAELAKRLELTTEDLADLEHDYKKKKTRMTNSRIKFVKYQVLLEI